MLNQSCISGKNSSWSWCATVSIQFSSVTQSYLTLFYPMDHSMLGFPVHHQLPELAQTHVHQVSDTIQLSHSLSSPSPPIFNLSQHQVFSNESVLGNRWPQYWSFSFSISSSHEYSGLIPLGLTGWISLQFKGLFLLNRNFKSKYQARSQ